MKKPNDGYVDIESLAWGALSRSLQAQEKEMFEELIGSITKHKPAGLDELEVIYHNKEVY